MYICLNVKPLKKCMYFCTKISDLVMNYVHHGKNHPFQEVEYGYMFVNIFVDKYDYLTNVFNNAVFSRRKLTIEPTRKLEFYI